MMLRHLAASGLLMMLILFSGAALAAAEEAILLIEQTSGTTGVQRDGKRLALKSGDALQEQDLIVTEANGRMTLRLGRHGFVEVGPNAEIGVERLPYAAFARDLKSIFSVSKGYFRVVWKYPQTATNWPLFVYMSGHRISLVSGEYFFQGNGATQRACVAAGQIALQAASSEGVETIKPPACAQLAVDVPMQVVPRNPDDWIAMRRSFDVEATAAALLSKEAATVTPLAAATTTTIAAPPADTTRPAPPAAARSSALPLGPVVEAPVLPAPLRAPPTAMMPALPEPPLALPAASSATPVLIGEVQAAPVAAAPLKPIAAPPPKPAAVPAAPAALPPAASSTVPVKTSGQWTLNIASYSDVVLAELEVERLREAGYSASTAAATVNGKTWHRVQVGGYASEQAATAAAVEINSRFNIPNIWVLKP